MADTDHAERARTLLERGYLTPTIDHALLAMKDGDEALALEMRAIVGIALQKKAMTTAALIPLDAVLEARPDHAAALASRGTARNSLGRNQEARADLERALELDPANGEGWETLANLCHASGDDQARDVAMSKLAELDKLPGYLLQLRGKQRLDSGEAEAGAADLRKAAQLGDPMSAFMLHDAGCELATGQELAAFALDREKRQMPDAAIISYRKAIERGIDDPASDVMWRDRLARLLDQAGGHDEAVALMRGLTDAHPERADAWLSRAFFDAEITSYEKAYDLAPADNATAWARHLLGAGRKDEALAICTRHLEEDPDAIALHTLHGEILLASEQADAAKTAWLRAEALGDHEARRLRVGAFGCERGLDFFDAALDLLDRNLRDDAVVEFENAIDLLREESQVPGDEANRYLAKSLYNSAFLRELKVADEIIEPNMREAVELDPTYTDAMLGLGNLCMRTDRVEEGLGWFARVGELDPSSGQPWYYRARHFAEHGDNEAAVADASRAFAAYSSRGQGQFAADAVMMRGQANQALGRLEDAKRDYDLACDWGHPTGYSMGEQIRELIALEDPSSDAAFEMIEAIVERIEAGECPWGQIDFLEGLTTKSEKATALVEKLKADEELGEEETSWLVSFLYGAGA